MEVFADDLQGKVEGIGDVLVGEVEALDQCFCCVALVFEPLLLLVEERAADAVFVVHVQQLSLLLFDFFKDALAALDLLACGGHALAEILSDGVSYLLALGVAEDDGGVVALDRCFDQVDGQVALRAFAALVLDADEVFVGAAVAFVLGVGEPAATEAAADRALERVLVLAVALAGVTVRSEDRLDPVEEVLADQRLVPARIVLAAVADDAGVVGVTQQLVDTFEVQRLWAVAAGAT